MPNGIIFLYFPKGLKDAKPVPSGVLTLHKRGKTAIAKGSELEAYLSSGLPPESEKTSQHVVKCPALVDLTGNRYGICVVSYPQLKVRQRFRVSVEDTVGLKMVAIDAIVDRQKLQTDAQSDLNRRLRDNGDTPDAKVTCQKGLLVIRWPGEFSCEATAGGKRYKLLVFVRDAKGTSDWRGVPEP
jgi:hypothetical protein